MALREEDIQDIEEIKDADEGLIPADWFWRPLQRHQTVFVQTEGERSAWRESGRRLQIANRVASQVDSKQASLAYFYEREGERGASYQQVTNGKKGRTKW